MTPAASLGLDDLPDVLTVEDFASFARIGRRQAYEAVGRGEIYSARIGRSIRIPRQAVVNWLAGVSPEPPAAAAAHPVGRPALRLADGPR